MLNHRSCSVQKIALILIALLVFLNPKLIWDLYMVDCCWLLCTVQMGWAWFTSIKRATANRGHLLTLRSEIRERERAKESEQEIAYTSPLVFILQSAPLSLIVPFSICQTRLVCQYIICSLHLSGFPMFISTCIILSHIPSFLFWLYICSSVLCISSDTY